MVGIVQKLKIFGSPPGVGWALGGVEPTVAETYGFRYRRKDSTEWSTVVCSDVWASLEAEQALYKCWGQDFVFDTLEDE